MGVFGVKLGAARGASVFLHTSLAILQEPSAMLWITAEGAFTDHRIRPIALRPGLAHLARRVPNAMIVPMALEYSFWNESRAEVLVRFGTPIESGAGDVVSWNDRLATALTQTMDALAAESMTRDPSLFMPLVRGRTGVGGIYDIWRGLKALAALRRFAPSHGGDA